MADDGKNPLDVLEELLNESSDGSGAKPAAKAPAAGGKDDGKPAEKTEEQLAKELKQKRAEFEKMEDKHEAVDEQKLAEQREAIVGIKDTKEYQARVDQNAEKVKDEEKKAVAGEGFEIDQLDHSKV